MTGRRRREIFANGPSLCHKRAGHRSTPYKGIWRGAYSPSVTPYKRKVIVFGSPAVGPAYGDTQKQGYLPS